MIPRQQKNTLEVVGDMPSRQVTIAANSVAFRALIDGMYADKIGSIMRELWTNAWDAHAEVGKEDTPFKVILPTTLLPEFTVRDYGVSMTHETVMELFSTMFDSSKRGSNKVAGKFGVGSKSPLAYVDAYTVTCYLDGTVRVYSIHIGKDQSPQVALMAEGETDEPDGVSVSFAVEQKDFLNFRKAAAKTAVAFEPRPLINLGESIFDETPSAILKGTNWTLYDSNGWKLGPRIKMGCVTYPIDASRLPDELKAAVGDSSLVVEVQIGDCDVVLSREALSYDEDTEFNMIAAFTEAIKDIARTISDGLEESVDYGDACRRADAFRRSLQKAGLTLPDAASMWEGLPLASSSWIPLYMVSAARTRTKERLQEEADGTFSLNRSEWGGIKKTVWSLGEIDKTLFVFTVEGKTVNHLGHRIRQYFVDHSEDLKDVRLISRVELERKMTPDVEALRTMLCGVPRAQVVLGSALPCDRKRFAKPRLTGPYHYTQNGGYFCDDVMPSKIDAHLTTAGAHDPDPAVYPRNLIRTYDRMLKAAECMGWSPTVLHLTKKQRACAEELKKKPDFFEWFKKKFEEIGSRDQLLDWYALGLLYSRVKKTRPRCFEVLEELEFTYNASALLDEETVVRDVLVFIRSSRSLIEGAVWDIDRVMEVDLELGLSGLSKWDITGQETFRRQQLRKIESEHPIIRLIDSYLLRRTHKEQDDIATPIAELLTYLQTTKGQ